MLTRAMHTRFWSNRLAMIVVCDGATIGSDQRLANLPNFAVSTWGVETNKEAA